ncbi:MAG: mechanosensitive ion channel [Myxococcota bacterium]|jgi:small conductance mechanosensitive channel|nr:mechanosensitive ion channel [Myxococcota bacterium]
MDPNELNEAGHQLASTAIDLLSSWGLQVVGAILVLIAGRWVAARAGKLTRRSLTRANIDAQLIPFFGQAVHYSVLAVVIIAVLQLFGIETTSLVAVVGAAGLAVGLALQGTLSSFAAGVMLLVMRPFKIGDAISVGGSTGVVSEVSLFTTTINTFDNIQIIIPNSSVYGTTIKNFSANENRRIDLIMGVSYDDDLGKAISIIESVLAADERILADPAPTVAVAELGDSAVNIMVRPWVAASNYGRARGDLTRALKEGIEAGGCSFPYPQQDVHLATPSDAG